MSKDIVFSNDNEKSSVHPLKPGSPLYRLLCAYGLDNEHERIREALPFGQEVFYLIDVLNVMARMGYTGSPLKTRICDIDMRLLPCVFIEEKYGTLQAVTQPSQDKTKGTAYIFVKQEIKDPKEQKEVLAAAGRGWFMNAIVRRFHALFWKVMAISFLLNLVALAMPLFLMVTYDHVTDTSSTQSIYTLGIGAAIMLTMEATLRSLRSRRLAWFAARIDNIVSNRVLSRLLQLPAHAIERASVASQVSRLRAFDSVREFFTGPLFLTLLDLPFTIVTFLALTMLGGTLAFLPLGVLVAYGILMVIFRSHLKFSMFHSARARSNAQTHHIELFEKLQTLRLNGMNEVWREKFRDISASASISSFQAQYLAQILETLIYTVTTITGIAIIYIGVTQVWAGVMTGGALFASLMLFWRVTAPWQALAGSLPRLEQLMRSIQQIDRLMMLDTERESAPALGKLAKMQGTLEFLKVGLRYSKDNDPVFVGLNFTTNIGELIAIAGGNGSGKSTVLKLALGLYRPQAGAIFLDGRDIRQIDPVNLRKNIAYVPQIPELFEGTIADNLRFGNPAATDNDLWHALELSDAKSQIEHMPLGLNTPIIRGVDSLRSNLVYRIILARAYVRDSPLLLIDEMPYAILNSRTGAMFLERLREWHGKKTIVMVSHRDDHIQMSDRSIGLLEGGRFIINTPDKVIQQLRNESFQHRHRSLQ